MYYNNYINSCYLSKAVEPSSSCIILLVNLLTVATQNGDESITHMTTAMLLLCTINHIPIDLMAAVRTRVKLDIGISVVMGTTATVDRLDAMCLLKTSVPITKQV